MKHNPDKCRLILIVSSNSFGVSLDAWAEDRLLIRHRHSEHLSLLSIVILVSCSQKDAKVECQDVINIFISAVKLVILESEADSLKWTLEEL